MKAIHVDTTQPSRPLTWAECAEPACAADEVIVDIHATALNRADLAQRAGNYPPPPGATDILGLEMAGVISRLGEKVAGWQIGDRVCALLPGGGYAEKVAVPQAMLMPIPAGWSFEQAAGLPEVYLTAFVNLYTEAALQPGESVLVHGGASGVGTAAIQLLKASGNPVFVTAGSDDKCAACLNLGATAAINYKREDWVARVKELSNGTGVDVILDMVGADYFAQNISLLKLRGRLVFIATLGGVKTELDIRHLMGKRLKVIGSVLRSRSLAEKITIKENFMARFWRNVESGELQPVIDSVYPISQIDAAYQRMGENQNIGKIILRIS